MLGPRNTLTKHPEQPVQVVPALREGCMEGRLRDLKLLRGLCAPATADVRDHPRELDASVARDGVPARVALDDVPAVAVGSALRLQVLAYGLKDVVAQLPEHVFLCVALFLLALAGGLIVLACGFGLGLPGRKPQPLRLSVPEDEWDGPVPGVVGEGCARGRESWR